MENPVRILFVLPIDMSIIFENNVRFSCVFAFFILPLQRFKEIIIF